MCQNLPLEKSVMISILCENSQVLIEYLLKSDESVSTRLLEFKKL